MAIVTLRELKRLLHPHYLLNVVLALSYVLLRVIRPFCSILFPASGCELDFRETEILTFLAIIVLFRTRKMGVVEVVPYLSTACMYTKVANVLLFCYSDPRMGIVYVVLCVVHLVLLPEPSYEGPDDVVYFHGPALEEELDKDKRVTWLVTFFAVWSPACVNLAPIFAELSAKYSLDNLKFGKIDVTRYPQIAEKYRINTSSFSKQLPTVILFQGGKAVMRRPTVDTNSKLIKFAFTGDNIVSAFDLNNLYKECKNNPIRKAKNKETTDHAKTE